MSNNELPQGATAETHPELFFDVDVEMNWYKTAMQLNRQDPIEASTYGRKSAAIRNTGMLHMNTVKG